MKDALSTNITSGDFSSAIKDEYGVFYSQDGKRLLGIRDQDFLPDEYIVKDGTEVICDNAFQLTSLNKIAFPDSLVIIGERTFDECLNLKQVIMSNHIRTIKKFAFRKCISLKNILLPNSIEIIEEMSFAFSGLTELTIPSNCFQISGNPFHYNNVKIISKSPHFIVDDNILFTRYKDEIISFQNSAASYIIPNSVKKIRSFAFDKCFNLKEVVIPSSITYIGINPFHGCKTVLYSKSKKFHVKDGMLIDKDTKTLIYCNTTKEIINVPYGVTTIGALAFAGLGIKKIKLPYSITCINEFAFEFSKIEKIRLPNSIKKLGEFAFSHCSHLKEINIPKSLIYYGNGIFASCHSLREINIPNNLKFINMGMFSNCFQLRNITIPHSVIKIGDYSFYVCKSLKEVIIPKSVKYIGKSAFQNCQKLKEVYIPDTVKYIGSKAFNDCQTFTTIRYRRSTYREYDSLRLIATTPGNKDKLARMLPHFLHNIIKEMTYKEFISRDKSKYSKVKTEEGYGFGSLERVKCPRCGNWYFEDDGVCNICGFPWNE